MSASTLCEGTDEGHVALCITKERNRPHHVNLFLLEGTDDQGNDLQHYVWIKNMLDSSADEPSITARLMSVICAYTPFA